MKDQELRPPATRPEQIEWDSGFTESTAGSRSLCVTPFGFELNHNVGDWVCQLQTIYVCAR